MQRWLEAMQARASVRRTATRFETSALGAAPPDT
jgi:hypothetical protein